jgi:hypothetical protein
MKMKMTMRKTLKTSVCTRCRVIVINNSHFLVTTVDYSHEDDNEEPIQEVEPRRLAFEDADNEREENEALAKHFQTKSASYSYLKTLDTMRWAQDKNWKAFARMPMDAQVFIVRVQVLAIHYSF